MPKQRELQKEKSTQVMLNAALEEFAQKGFSASRIGSIAERAGVAKGLVSTRFNSKDELYCIIATNCIQETLSEISDYSSIENIFEFFLNKLRSMVLQHQPKDEIILQLIKADDIPEVCSESVHKVFDEHGIHEVIKNASEKGLIVNDEPIQVVSKFAKSGLALCESYITAGFELPDNQEMLKLVQFGGKINEKQNNNQNTLFAIRDICYQKLTQDYSDIYFVDLNKDSLIAVAEHNAYFGAKSSETQSYSKKMREYAKIVSPEFIEAWLKMADVTYVQQFLSKEDKREYVYSLASEETENSWHRISMFVVERKQKVPQTMILTFTNVDTASAQKYELDKKINEQKKVLETQAVLLEEAYARVEKASNAKTTFLTNLSHDIRTPMNAIMGFTSLALNNVKDTQHVQEYLQKAVISSKHLLDLINDILDMSRIENGNLQINEQQCNLIEIIKEVATIVNSQIEAKQQKLFIDYSSVTEENVLCDKLRLHQVLINLITNSIKFSPIGENIYVIVRQTSINKQTASFEFHVKDNGIGMSHDFLERIFQPFETEFNKTVSRSSGSGLGLAISKNIIDMMGGSITVNSEPGKGSEFTVYLSLKLSDKLDFDETEDFFVHSLKGKRILIVDDNSFNLDITFEMLYQQGINVDIAENGKQAVEKVKSLLPNKYDAVLMDVQMPVLNGYEATKQIRAIQGMSFDKLPIIAMTANAFAQDRTAAFDAGMNAHLVKPVSVDNLFRVLQENINC